MIELLVAVVIAAFVGAVGVFALQSITADRKRLESRVSVSGEMRYAMEQIADDLDNLYRSRDMRRMRFMGTLAKSDEHADGRITFYAMRQAEVRPGRPEGDVYEVEYFLRRQDDRSILLRRIWPNPHRQGEPGGIIAPVAENIIAFDARYYDGLEWCDAWEEDKKDLPEMIEIHLAARQPGERFVLEQSRVFTFPRLPRPQQNQMPVEKAQVRQSEK